MVVFSTGDGGREPGGSGGGEESRHRQNEWEI
jgi:hypothetical protein